jgi:apolipoprotein N-acyltransferase
MKGLSVQGWRHRIMPEHPGPALLSGVLLGLAHPPFNLLVPSFVALVPFIVWHASLPATSDGARQARAGGFFLGLIYFTLVFYWLLVALIFYTAWAVGAFLTPIIVLSGMLWLMSGAIHATRRWLGWPVWVAFPVFWTSIEWLRAHLADVSFPWMQLGDTLAGYPQLVGAADLVGSRGISFWLVAVNALVAAAWLRGKTDGPRRALPLVGALVATLAAPIAYSLIRWTTLEMIPAAIVGVVQPNVPEHIKIGNRRVAADSAIRATETLAAGWMGQAGDGAGSIDLLLLPESAIPDYPEPLPSAGYPGLSELDGWATGLADRLDADVLWGSLGITDHGAGYDRFNSAFLTRPGVGRVARYDKRFLVPVVERVPFLPPSWFSKLTYFGGFGVGGWAQPLPVRRRTDSAGDGVPDGAAVSAYGVMICYESIFSSLARHYRLGGADFLVNITNDAWFGREAWWSRSSALWQHPAHLVMRTIETRMGAARSANTGVSELIDPLGRVSQATPLFEPAAFRGQVMTTSGLTVYVRYGDAVGWAAALAAILGLALSVKAGRRSRRDSAR